MLATPPVAGPTGPSPPPPPPVDPGLAALSQVKDTANTIATRVRQALTPEEFRPLRVLVVDDHPDAADALAAVLDLLGCPVRACYDGLSALAAAEEFDPQVCLLDLLMPGMDGLELASRLKVRPAGRRLFLVATTALADDEARARTSAAGFHYHLTKPVDAPTLIDTLANLGEVIARPADPPGQPPGTP
jgi:CheY-like chemotaxis protein